MQETIQGLKEGLLEGMDKVASVYNVSPEDYEQFVDDVITELTSEDIEKSAGLGSMHPLMSGAANALGVVGKDGITREMFRTPKGLALGALGMGLVGAGAMLGRDAIAGAASMAVNKVGNAYQARGDRQGFERAFDIAVKRSEILQADKQKAKRMADSIFGFAPLVAQDPNVLGNILDNVIYGDSIDLTTVRAVTELEEKLVKTRKAKQEL